MASVADPACLSFATNITVANCLLTEMKANLAQISGGGVGVQLTYTVHTFS